MEEFLFVLHDLRAGEFDFDIAHQQNAAIELDGHVVVDTLQVGQLIRVNLCGEIGEKRNQTEPI